METKTELRTDENGAFFEITATARVRVTGAAAIAREASKCSAAGDFMRACGFGFYGPESEITETAIADKIAAEVLAATIADAMHKARFAEIFTHDEPGDKGRFIQLDMETGKRMERGTC